MPNQKRIEAARAYVDALRTGDHAIAAKASPHLAKDITVQVGPRKFEGHDEALKRITGVWPQTPVYRKGTWPAPVEEGDKVAVRATMMPMGAGINNVNLTFSFNSSDQISGVVQENVVTNPLHETDKLPDFIKARVNNALANDTPIAVSYVDEQGRPHLSLRGSTQAYSDTQLSIWARTGTGLPGSVAKNPNVSLLYRENPTRSTLTFMGMAHIDSDPAVRKRIFEGTPEVEQNHESWETGVAIVIDLDSVDGGTPEGRIKFRRS